MHPPLPPGLRDPVPGPPRIRMVRPSVRHALGGLSPPGSIRPILLVRRIQGQCPRYERADMEASRPLAKVARHRPASRLFRLGLQLMAWFPTSSRASRPQYLFGLSDFNYRDDDNLRQQQVHAPSSMH